MDQVSCPRQPEQVRCCSVPNATVRAIVCAAQGACGQLHTEFPVPVLSALEDHKEACVEIVADAEGLFHVDAQDVRGWPFEVRATLLDSELVHVVDVTSRKLRLILKAPIEDYVSSLSASERNQQQVPSSL